MASLVEERYLAACVSAKKRQTIQGVSKTMETMPRLAARAAQLGRFDLLASGDASVVHERIIGATNELQPVDFLFEGVRAAQAVGRISMWVSGRGTSYGTGFFISPTLVMTNNHVIRDAGEAEGAVINVGYRTQRGRLLAGEEIPLRPGRFFVTDAHLDYTVVGAGRPNGGFVNLIPQSGKAILNERLNIIQHPNGQPQKVAVRKNQWIGRRDAFFHYTTDTLAGSSGSPVFNDQWDLVGLHHAGVPRTDSRGDWLLKDGGLFDGSPEQAPFVAWSHNEGVRTSYIVCDVLGKISNDPARIEAFEDALVGSDRV